MLPERKVQQRKKKIGWQQPLNNQNKTTKTVIRCPHSEEGKCLLTKISVTVKHMTKRRMKGGYSQSKIKRICHSQMFTVSIIKRCTSGGNF